MFARVFTASPMPLGDASDEPRASIEERERTRNEGVLTRSGARRSERIIVNPFEWRDGGGQMGDNDMEGGWGAEGREPVAELERNRLDSDGEVIGDELDPGSSDKNAEGPVFMAER
jgi:hypothetical protein